VVNFGVSDVECLDFTGRNVRKLLNCSKNYGRIEPGVTQDLPAEFH
jgi:hypothetical protein